MTERPWGRQFLPDGSFGAPNEKASLEGMSEAFGSSAGADDQREAAREEERPQSLERGYAGRGRVRQTRSRKARHAELEGRSSTGSFRLRVGQRWWWGRRSPWWGSLVRPPGQKKRLHPKMEPYESGGSRTREEETPSAIGSYRGRRFGSDPCRENTGPREEGAVRRLSDTLYMRLASVFSNEGADMSAMHLMQGRSVCLTQKKTFWMDFPQRSQNNKALLEGRAGPKFERGKASRKGDAGQARRERDACRRRRWV